MLINLIGPLGHKSIEEQTIQLTRKKLLNMSKSQQQEIGEHNDKLIVYG